MRRIAVPLAFIVAAIALPAVSFASAGAAKHQPVTAIRFPVNFEGHLTGKIIYLNRFAGMEPDFDILSRVVIEGTIHSKSEPAMTLILDSFIENFQTETQPVLPDLLHPNQELSYTLGGFFSGDALVLGPGGSVLYAGHLYVEALISPACINQLPSCNKQSEANHMLLDSVVGQGVARRGRMELRSLFFLKVSGKIRGTVWGKLWLPRRARALLRHGSGHLSAQRVLTEFSLAKPPQKGTSGGIKGGKGFCLPGGKHCTGTGHVGTPPPTSKHTNSSAGSTTSSRPPWMAPLGGALIGLAFVLLGIYFWQSRKNPVSRKKPAAHP